MHGNYGNNLVQAFAQVDFTKAGCSGLFSVSFWVSSQMIENLQPLQANCSSIWYSHNKNKIFALAQKVKICLDKDLHLQTAAPPSSEERDCLQP